MVYGQARWLVKWQGYDESRNTWEPWEHLLTDALREEAKAVRLAAAPTTLTAVGKLCTEIWWLVQVYLRTHTSINHLTPWCSWLSRQPNNGGLP